MNAKDKAQINSLCVEWVKRSCMNERFAKKERDAALRNIQCGRAAAFEQAARELMELIK